MYVCMYVWVYVCMYVCMSYCIVHVHVIQPFDCKVFLIINDNLFIITSNC